MRFRFLAVVVLSLIGIRPTHAMMTQQIGPNSAIRGFVSRQTGEGGRFELLLGSEARVYSNWVNGNENFYFKADVEEINRLIDQFSKVPMRDHVVWIKQNAPTVTPFESQKIDYNVNLHVLGGIVLSSYRSEEKSETYDPTLTIYLGADSIPAVYDQLVIPSNIVLNNEIGELPLVSPEVKPERKVWYARIMFDETTPVWVRDAGVQTEITYWNEGEEGISLGKVNKKGVFHAAFSDEEIAKLKSGERRLTVTFGNWSRKPQSTDAVLSIDQFALEKKNVEPVIIDGPEYYYGRILWEDGSVPVFDPQPWPGDGAWVEFKKVGRARIDSEGYFKIFLTDDQFENAKQSKVRNNILIPVYDGNNASTPLFFFPISELSREKEKAHVVTIPRPNFKRTEQ